jgi:hypothetical protein
MVKDLLYHVEIQIDNTGGLAYGGFLRWNRDGSYITFDSQYIAQPVRNADVPRLLDELNYNTNCHDFERFDCVVCDGLCIEC